jgi:roadblock/LC7 domain-containing protein
MNLDWGIFKRHPYMTGIGAVGVFLLIFLSRKSGGASSSGGSSGTDLQLAQLQAAANAQNNQAQVAVTTAQLQAQVQSQAITASQDVQNNQTSAQLAAIEAQTQAQTAIYSKQADAQTAQAETYASIIKGQYQSQVDIHGQTVDYLNNLTNQQAAVASQQIDAATYIQGKAIDAQQTNLQTVKDLIPDFQHLGIGENYNNEIIGLVGAVTGQSNVATSGINSTSAVVANNNTVNSASSIIGSIGNAATGVLAGLFAA